MSAAVWAPYSGVKRAGIISVTLVVSGVMVMRIARRATLIGMTLAGVRLFAGDGLYAGKRCLAEFLRTGGSRN